MFKVVTLALSSLVVGVCVGVQIADVLPATLPGKSFEGILTISSVLALMSGVFTAVSIR
jgi:hypothetical protein